MFNQYKEKLADSIGISSEDLSKEEELLIINSFDMFQAKVDEIKVLQDEITRLSIELANQKAMNRNID